MKWMKEQIEKTGTLEIPSVGTSMYPLIKAGNMCTFIPFQPNEARKGDIILFLTNEGRLVGHRILYISKDDGDIRYICKGDANLTADMPVTADNIIGKLVSIKKSNRRISVQSPFIKLWGRVIMTFPVISRVLQRSARR